MVLASFWKCNNSGIKKRSPILNQKCFNFFPIVTNILKMKMQTTRLIWGFGGPGPLQKDAHEFSLKFEFVNILFGHVFDEFLRFLSNKNKKWNW